MNEQENKKQKPTTRERQAYRRERQAMDALVLATEQINTLKQEISALKQENEALKNNPDWSQALLDERFVEEYAMRDEQLRKRIIEEYLRSLTLSGGAPVLRGAVGSIPLTPPKKPRSLAEAKKMAEILIKG